MKKLEIYWKLINLKYDDWLILMKKHKLEILKQLRKWCKEWFIHNKDKVIWEWTLNFK